MAIREDVNLEECWDALYQMGGAGKRRELAARGRLALGALAALCIVLGGGVAWSQAAWQINLTTFSPNTPAVATEVNNNFSQIKTAVEQLKTWQDSKVGAADSPNVMTRGFIQQDVTAADYDVWIQGSSAAAGGDLRNLALLGLAQGRGDKLILNYGGEYSFGTEVQSRLNVLGTLNVSGGAIINGETTVQGPLSVTGEVISNNRYVVTARYDADFFQGGIASSSAALDMNRFYALCSDAEGCSIQLIMDQFNAAGESASLGPLHFSYNSSTGRFRVADFSVPGSGEIAVTYGTDGDSALQHALRGWNCYFTDTNYTQGTANTTPDNTRSMYLLNFNANTNYKGWCMLVIDD